MALPKITIKANNSTVKEGDIAKFTVTLSKALTKDVKISYSTADGTAKSGSDYVKASTKLVTIKAGTTSQTFDVQTKTDSTVEKDETFKINFTNKSTSLATLSTKSLTETIKDGSALTTDTSTGTNTSTTSGQTFKSSTGADNFTATDGADTFLFAQQTTGKDVITGFDPKMDKLVFGSPTATNQSRNATEGTVGPQRDHNAKYVLDLYTNDKGNDVVIMTDHSSSITLLGVHKADLSASNFEFNF